MGYWKRRATSRDKSNTEAYEQAYRRRAKQSPLIQQDNLLMKLLAHRLRNKTY